MKSLSDSDWYSNQSCLKKEKNSEIFNALDRNSGGWYYCLKIWLEHIFYLNRVDGSYHYDLRPFVICKQLVNFAFSQISDAWTISRTITIHDHHGGRGDVFSQLINPLSLYFGLMILTRFSFLPSWSIVTACRILIITVAKKTGETLLAFI